MIGSWSARRLRNRWIRGAKGQSEQDQARYTVAGAGGDRHQSQAVARGRRGQSTIQ